MSAYIGLITIFLFFATFIKTKVSSKERQELYIARFGMVLIFLLLALKAETVGIDIIGYKTQYELMHSQNWGDFTYYHFEPGYVAATMLFAKLTIPFQGFMAVVYAFWCHAIYSLIKRFSPNATLSILIFICYSFLVFSISGVRQTIAMTICLYAFFAFLKKQKRYKMLAVLLILLAMSFHESAVVFGVVLIIMLMKRKVHLLIWMLLTVVTVLFRAQIWDAVFLIYHTDATEFTMGGNFIFLLGMVVFIGFSYHYQQTKLHPEQPSPPSESSFDFDGFSVRSAFLCVLCFIIFSGGTLLRANMYYTLIFIPSIPHYISKYNSRTRFILNAAMGVFMILLFYFETLAINELQLCPYRFFWQE